MTQLDYTAYVIPTLLILAMPLAGFIINGLAGKRIPSPLSGWIATAAVAVSFICSVYLFLQIPADGFFSINLFDWLAFDNIKIGFSFLIDPLTVVMLLMITGIGSLIHLYSIGYMHDDEGFTRFFAYLNLFVFFMLILVMGSNYLIMFIGWEGVGLCSYLLIGFWFKNNAFNNAAKKAFVMNRIGDLGFLLAMFFMLFHFGTLEYNAVAEQAETFGSGSVLITTIAVLLFIGAMGKSAQLPLATWLPDAMAGPTPVSALIHAATMVTAGIYMVVRSNVLYALSPDAMSLVLAAGVITCVFGAVIGLMQNDIKKVLAYSTVSQLGLMFAALGIGAFSSGMFHVVTHAFFKALLFLGSGSVIHALHGEQDIRKMGGLGKYIKITFITFVIGSLAISGIFPFAGFFSKDEILAHSFEHNTLLWIILSVSSMLTAFYMFRLVFLTFSGTFRGSEETRKHIHESPALLTVPLLVLAALSVIGGFMGLPEGLGFTHAFKNYLSFVTAPGSVYLHHGHGLSHTAEYLLIGTSLALAIVSIWYAHKKYFIEKILPHEENALLPAFQKLVYHKFYLDEIYNTVFVKPLRALSDSLPKLVDKLIIDSAVNSTARLAQMGGKTLRLLQTGNTGIYLFAMVGSVILLFIISMFVK